MGFDNFDTKKLADLLFPDVTMTEEELEKIYPPRDLPQGAKVTRFAPSPTGFVHFGGMYQAVVDWMLAKQSGGVFMLRIEDTDGQREVRGAVEALLRTLGEYGITYDEGVIMTDSGDISEKGRYGPYKQSERANIYAVYAKRLVAEGHAYPVFSTEEELETIQHTNKKEEIASTDWHTAAAEKREEMLARRHFTLEEVEEHLKAGDPFVIRILADGSPDIKTKFTDLVKGDLLVPENDEDFVLLKSDGIPTYHFAHAVDDHLMRTTHVIRGEDWLPSLPKHIQLFRYLGFRLPKYLHTAQILKSDEEDPSKKKKLSKRDMGAKMDDYSRIGYPREVVWEYLLTLLNSNYEEWRMQNPDVPVQNYPFSIKKMSVSGCLFDIKKLNDISATVISRMSTEQVYSEVVAWAKENDPAFAALLEKDPEYAKSVFAIGRGGKKPRKDITFWSGVKEYVSFFYDDLFKSALPENSFPKDDIITSCNAFLKTYDESDDSDKWFNKIKSIAAEIGYASEMKAYKANPDAFRGHVGDVSMFLRVAVTGRENSPDLYTCMQILGKEKVTERIRKMIDELKK